MQTTMQMSTQIKTMLHRQQTTIQTMDDNTTNNAATQATADNAYTNNAAPDVDAATKTMR